MRQHTTGEHLLPQEEVSTLHSLAPLQRPKWLPQSSTVLRWVPRLLFLALAAFVFVRGVQQSRRNHLAQHGAAPCVAR